MDEIYSITELADELGATPRAIRFYESKGLVSPQRAGNTRVYTKRDVGRMKLILRGKRLGFSLADIKEYLDLYDIDPTKSSQIKLLMEKVDQRIVDLEQQQRDIKVALEELEDIRTQAKAAIDGGLS